MTKKMDEEIIRTDKAFTQLFNQKSIAFQIKNFVFYYSTKKKHMLSSINVTSKMSK